MEVAAEVEVVEVEAEVEAEVETEVTEKADMEVELDDEAERKCMQATNDTSPTTRPVVSSTVDNISLTTGSFNRRVARAHVPHVQAMPASLVARSDHHPLPRQGGHGKGGGDPSWGWRREVSAMEGLQRDRVFIVLLLLFQFLTLLRIALMLIVLKSYCYTRSPRRRTRAHRATLIAAWRSRRCRR